MKEYLRQSLHILLGTTFLITTFLGLTDWRFFLFLLIICYLGLIFVLVTDMIDIESLLVSFERPNAYLLGWGALNLIAGFLLLTLFFTIDIALPALAIMVYADGIATIAGRPAKSTLPWHKNKTWVGSLAFLIVALFISAHFLPFGISLIVSKAATIVESIPRPKVLDDNLLLPLVVAIILAIII